MVWVCWEAMTVQYLGKYRIFKLKPFVLRFLLPLLHTIQLPSNPAGTYEDIINTFPTCYWRKVLKQKSNWKHRFMDAKQIGISRPDNVLTPR